MSLSGNITASGGISATGSGTSVSANILYVYGGKSQILNSDGSQIFPPEDEGNLNITSGISTFYQINVINQGSFDEIFTSSIGSFIGIFERFVGIGIDAIDEDDLEDTNLLVVGNSEFSGDVAVGTGNTQGVILTSPDGTRYRLRVNNAGDVSAVAV